jgi:NADH dehydrogenase
MNMDLHAVTGAFGYSGKYIARRLIEAGNDVVTLTNSPHRSNPFGDRIRIAPLSFDEPDLLVRSLVGVRTLYNTYWVRFNHKGFTHQEAVENTLRLIQAAINAGVERIIHVSITNPSVDSPFEYFRGKAELENAIIHSGPSYAILRPAILFGEEDVLINNIAWMLRRFPIFGIFGTGAYKVQPIYVDDLARNAVQQGTKTENSIIDAIGPETFTYRQLVEAIGEAIGKRRLLISTPPRIAYLVGLVLGKVVGDVTITWDEVGGLMAGLLCVDSPPSGDTPLTVWASQHSSTIGQRYANELQRRRV